MTTTSIASKRKSALSRVLGLASAAMVGITLSLTASPALALDPSPESPGAGEGTLTVDPGTVSSGETITIKGSGFARRPANGELSFKLNDGKNPALKFPTEGQPSGVRVDAAGTATVKDANALPDAQGNFTAKLKLPQISEEGDYRVRIVGGAADGGATVSKWARFRVSNQAAPAGKPSASASASSADKPSTNPTEKPSAGASAAPAGKPSVGPTDKPTATPSSPSKVEVKATDISTADDGKVSVAIEGSGFKAGELSASVNGTDLSWVAGRSTLSTLKVADDGKISGTLSIPAGLTPVGKNHEIKLSGAAGQATVEFMPVAGLAFSAGSAAGSTTNATVLNLPKGAVVKSIGVEGSNWISATHEVAEGTSVAVPDVKIPADAKVGAKIAVQYTINGKQVTFVSSSVVTPSNAPVNADKYEASSGDLPQGLYQSAYSAKENTLYVTSAVGRPPIKESKLLKVNPQTLKVAKDITPAAADEATGLYATYGVGLDDSKGYVWVTNTRQNTVAVYDRDLKLVKQFPNDLTEHPRDVVVDETTHLAYVSSARGDYVDVYSGATDQPTRVGRIKLSTANQKFDGAMSLTLDKESGTLYTVSRNTNAAAAIKVRGGNEVTHFQLDDAVKTASGVAYDPVNHHLFIASQGTNNAVVVDTNTGKTVANIPTGARALNAAYDSVNKVVYVANSGGGTVTVIDAATLKIVANLPAGTNTNHVTVHNGVAYVVDKGNPNKIHKFALKVKAPGGDPTTNPTAPGKEPTGSAQPSASGGAVTPPSAGPSAPNGTADPGSFNGAGNAPGNNGGDKGAGGNAGNADSGKAAGGSQANGGSRGNGGSQANTRSMARTLPNTGADVMIYGLAAVLLIGAGVLAIRARANRS